MRCRLGWLPKLPVPGGHPKNSPYWAKRFHDALASRRSVSRSRVSLLAAGAVVGAGCVPRPPGANGSIAGRSLPEQRHPVLGARRDHARSSPWQCEPAGGTLARGAIVRGAFDEEEAPSAAQSNCLLQPRCPGYYR